MKSRRLLLLSLIPLMLSLSCKKQRDRLHVINMDFKSLVMYDINANPLGVTGNPSDQFRNEEWPKWVHSHFKSMDTAYVPDGPATDPQHVLLYPNPAKSFVVLGTRLSAAVNVKMIVINTKGDCILKISRTVPGGAFRSLTLPVRETGVAKNNYYRLYYAFSVKEHRFFHKGHANFLLN